MTTLALGIATALGVGYVPIAPGTFGSAAGLLLWGVLPQSATVHALSVLAVFAVGTWASGIAERHYHATDPGVVVVDEVLGMLVTLLFNPVGWAGACLGFLLFRVFDVVKPYPANRLERLHGGFGVMADDAMAAVYANMVLRLLLAAAPRGLL
jgi:phosphatidylglycerophosphatase A